MSRKRATPRTPRSRVVQRKSMPRRRNSRWVALLFAILLVVGVLGTLVFQGREDTGGAKPISVLLTKDFHSLAFSPTEPDVVFFGHHDGIMRSDDGGRTWRQLVNRTNFDAMSLAISRNDSRLIYLAGHDIFQISRDGGATWSPVRNNLPDSDIHAFTSSLKNPQRFYAFIYGQGFFTSNNSGITWNRTSTQLPNETMTLAAAGDNPETLYAGSIESGAYKSTDGGQTWIQVKGLGSGGIMSVAVDSQAPKTVYAGGTAGLFKSTDGGDSWAKLDFPGSNIAALAISPAQPGVLLVINEAGRRGQVYRSEDFGVTWIR